MKYVGLLFLCVIAPIALAQSSDTVVVSQTITGGDTATPTVPTNLSVVPASDTQINVSWTASVDNIGIGGYQVFRNGSQIATTTLTTYADTLLTPSTLYGYRIVAFDTSFNYSSSTATVSTTTLASTTPSGGGGGSSGGGSNKSIATELQDFVVTPHQTSADISFTTNVFTQLEIRWGRTPSYELGYIANEQFHTDHFTTITGLEAGTLYEAQITLRRRFSDEVLVHTFQFTTIASADVIPPPNVTNLQVRTTPDGLLLEWENPTVGDFSHVRILSNDHFFPTDHLNGWFIYEGADVRALDSRLLEGDTRYYTAFAYDTNGNRSSGAVVLFTATPVIIPPISESDDAYRSFDFDDLSIMQDGLVRTAPNTVPLLEQDPDSIFSVPYTALPENLKTIIITLTHKDNPDRHFSFLLRLNAARDAYEAAIGSLPFLGAYDVTIAVYDHTEEVIIRRIGELSVTEEGDILQVERIETITRINWPLLVFILFVLLFLWWVIRRRRESRLDITKVTTKT